MAYETQRQTCDLHNAIKESTQTIVDGQKQAEMREMQNKIDSLREENSTLKSSAMTSPNCVAYQAGLYGLNAANGAGFWG